MVDCKISSRTGSVSLIYLCLPQKCKWLPLLRYNLEGKYISNLMKMDLSFVHTDNNGYGCLHQNMLSYHSYKTQKTYTLIFNMIFLTILQIYELLGNSILNVIRDFYWVYLLSIVDNPNLEIWICMRSLTTKYNL